MQCVLQDSHDAAYVSVNPSGESRFCLTLGTRTSFDKIMCMRSHEWRLIMAGQGGKEVINIINQVFCLTLLSVYPFLGIMYYIIDREIIYN